MHKLIKLIIISIIVLTAEYTSVCYADSNINLNNKLQSILDNFRQSSHAPAAVMSIKFLDKNTMLNFTSGTVLKKTSTNPNPAKVTTNNLFQIGSITKSFTAVIILQLEAEEKLSINDTVADTVKRYGQWLPNKEYDAWKNITIQQLLNMTSGIYDVTEDPQFNYAFLIKDPEKNWKPEEIISFAYKHKPYFTPGMGWHYSNTTYNILGMLIETITKHSVEMEMNQRILNPLNLKNTYYLPYLYPKNIMNRMAHGYAYPGGDFSPPAKSGRDMTYINMSVAGPSGAMVSNTDDIILWIEALFSGKILPNTQLKEMMSAVCMSSDNTCKAGQPLLPESKSEGFSLGLARMYDHQLGQTWLYIGGTAGYYSSFVWLPEKRIILAMTVSSSSSNSKKILRALMDAAKLLN